MTTEEINKLRDEIAHLRQSLRTKEEQLQQLESELKRPLCPYSKNLTTEEVSRYSRQMIIPQISLSGQLRLKNSKILIVGAGGLGCPSSLYLAAAGIGEIHIMDYDVVELSNLHRQVLHYEYDIGQAKSQSITDKLKSLNSNIKIIAHHLHVDSSIEEFFVKFKFDVVLDCTDNVPTRYLLNDLCVFHKIPLISGSALQMEGQLTIYNYGEGPCYRCLFPVPPPAYAVTNCGDGGVLGAVPGVIGVLQALEAVKILTKTGNVLSGRLLLFDGSESNFRVVKLRQKNSKCDVCGVNPKITSPVDYEQFCGSKAHDKVIDVDILKEEESVDIKKLNELIEEKNIVVDVRPEVAYEMCRIESTVNIPYDKLKDGKCLGILEDRLRKQNNSNISNVYVLCRRGNDSQRSVEYLKEHFKDLSVKFLSFRGGLLAYSKHVDSRFPVY